MCGLAGHWPAPSSHAALGADTAGQIGRRMADAIAHRGPDDSGLWMDASSPTLAHRRLSIIDLSASGHQPMMSHGGRYAIVFNGEIYNHLALRAELEETSSQIGWRGHSDTEVLLQAIERWGLAHTLPKLNGMFAFALWDRQEKVLALARDRFGEKPLYYGFAGQSLVFGSELKALYAHPEWSGELDPDAITDFLRFSYVPAPRSIFLNVRKLLPGCWVRLTAADVTHKAWPKSIAYWSARDAALESVASPASGSDAELIDETENQLRKAVKLRMMADVPLGAFLSGGIDSSTVVAMMQAQSSIPVKTFSIGFSDQRYNEATHAAEVARHLGTDHTELYVSEKDALDVIPRLPGLYDEPFADSSQIPSFLVSQMAREKVTVALTGDGGDELFGGYNRHVWVPRVWQLMALLPQAMRLSIAAALLRRSPAGWDHSFARIQRFLPMQLKAAFPGNKLHKLAGILGETEPSAVYSTLVSVTVGAAGLVARPGTGTPSEVLFPHRPELSLAQWTMLCDTINYMPDDILTKVDRATMGTSLESRVPLLDPELYAWAWRLPMKLKIQDGRGKWVLREILSRYVPRALIDRPKAGFGIPIDALLRGPLREWADYLLNARKLEEQGVLSAQGVREVFERHQQGASNNSYVLWNAVVLASWLDKYRAQIRL